MRFAWFAGIVAVMVLLVSPWLMASFDCASYSTELLGVIFPATGSAPRAETIATIAEDEAAKHGLVARAAVTVSDPRIKDPSKPKDPDNWIQDVHIEVNVQKRMLLGLVKRSHFAYDIALGGRGSANSWPP